MVKRLLYCMIGLIGVGLWMPPGGAGEPNGPYGLAQLRKADSAKNGTRASEVTPSAQMPGSPDKARLFGVRFLSSKSYSRVTIDLSHQVGYETHRLEEDSTKGLPSRIYVDLFRTKLAMDANDPIPVEDGVLRQVRVGQFTEDVVRIVIDLTTLGEYNAFLLADPYRLVVDIRRQNGAPIAKVGQNNSRTTKPAEKGKALPNLEIRKIVLDPGHGGKDTGAIGARGVAEKDIVLAVAKKLAKKLREDMGLEVVLTRKDDRFIPLEDRTAIANAEGADLFISLHMNASVNGEAKGLETYYLDNTTDEASLRLAARENGSSRKKISDLQFILSDMTQNMKLEDSITLAHRIQGSLVDGMSRKLADVKDLGVKKALFYVLVGAHMPSVLVEMFFITNQAEGRAMSEENTQNAVVDALYDGIMRYRTSNVASKTL
ncbi:MAG TPA: N-acetylmuramoyl-L-alanine amidase [Candidatus Binatia bacterium]|nr:N-acetylmuramoyl-L-alanine amidase [Candidatus Binatia bacterium]